MKLIDTENIQNNNFDYKKHIVSSSEINNYIDKYHKGDIKKGFGIGVEWVDKLIVAKENEFYAVVGKKGDGKTTIQKAWFLMWSIVNGVKWVCAFKENMDWSTKVGLLSQLLGDFENKVAKENPVLHKKASDWIDEHFIFIDVESIKEATEVCKGLINDGEKIHALILDPSNSFDSGFSETGNDYYDGRKTGKALLNFTKEYLTVHVSQHPTMSAQRREGDVFSYDAEMGAIFNKASFTYNINRTRGTSENRIGIENVRNKLTGGGETHPEYPLILHWSPTKIDLRHENNEIKDVIKFLKMRHNPLNEYFDQGEHQPPKITGVSVEEAFGTDEEDFTPF